MLYVNDNLDFEPNELSQCDLFDMMDLSDMATMGDKDITNPIWVIWSNKYKARGTITAQAIEYHYFTLFHLKLLRAMSIRLMWLYENT